MITFSKKTYCVYSGVRHLKCTFSVEYIVIIPPPFHTLLENVGMSGVIHEAIGIRAVEYHHVPQLHSYVYDKVKV